MKNYIIEGHSFLNYNYMQTPDALNAVKKFHTTFQHPVLDEPQIPARKRADLRVSLLQEELNELKEAIENNDLIEVADALADIQYVLAGAILEFGLGEKFKGIFDEVQRSNMSKACVSKEEAEETQAHYANNKNTESYIKEVNGKWLVFRKEDDKTLKSINYSPASIPDFL